MPRKRRRDDADQSRPIEQYEHPDKQRANNPPVGLVSGENDAVTARRTYAYDPHLDPSLEWAGKTEHASFEIPPVSLHVHERIDPRTIIEAVQRNGTELIQGSLFAAPSESPKPFAHSETPGSSHPLVPDVLTRSSAARPGAALRKRLVLRPDQRRKPSPCARGSRRRLWCRQLLFRDSVSKDQRQTSGASSPFAKTNLLGTVADYIVWYARHLPSVKYRQLYVERPWEPGSPYQFVETADERRRMRPEEATGDRQETTARKLSDLSFGSVGEPGNHPHMYLSTS
jgi:hypothetical protein